MKKQGWIPMEYPNEQHVFIILKRLLYILKETKLHIKNIITKHDYKKNSCCST